MYRATTPKHIFSFDVDPNETFELIEITYAQDGHTILQKSKTDLIFEDEKNKCNMYEAWLQLSQEETKLFQTSSKPIFDLQVRVKTYGDEVVAFPIVHRTVEDVLCDEVLT